MQTQTNNETGRYSRSRSLNELGPLRIAHNAITSMNALHHPQMGGPSFLCLPCLHSKQSQQQDVCSGPVYDCPYLHMWCDRGKIAQRCRGSPTGIRCVPDCECIVNASQCWSDDSGSAAMQAFGNPYQPLQLRDFDSFGPHDNTPLPSLCKHTIRIIGFSSPSADFEC